MYSGLNLFAKQVAKAIKEVMPCERVGACVMGLEVPHAHIHLVPFSQMEEMNFAHPKLSLDAAEMTQIAEKIRLAFEHNN